MSTKKRKYYSNDGTGVAKSAKKAFLLKWINNSTGVVMQDGPYFNEKDASEMLGEYLKSGICSWLVAYNE